MKEKIIKSDISLEDFLVFPRDLPKETSEITKEVAEELFRMSIFKGGVNIRYFVDLCHSVRKGRFPWTLGNLASIINDLYDILNVDIVGSLMQEGLFDWEEMSIITLENNCFKYFDRDKFNWRNFSHVVIGRRSPLVKENIDKINLESKETLEAIIDFYPELLDEFENKFNWNLISEHIIMYFPELFEKYIDKFNIADNSELILVYQPQMIKRHNLKISWGTIDKRITGTRKSFAKEFIENGSFPFQKYPNIEEDICERVEKILSEEDYEAILESDELEEYMKYILFYEPELLLKDTFPIEKIVKTLGDKVFTRILIETNDGLLSRYLTIYEDIRKKKERKNIPKRDAFLAKKIFESLQEERNADAFIFECEHLISKYANLLNKKTFTYKTIENRCFHILEERRDNIDVETINEFLEKRPLYSSHISAAYTAIYEFKDMIDWKRIDPSFFTSYPSKIIFFRDYIYKDRILNAVIRTSGNPHEKQTLVKLIEEYL